MVFRVNLAPLSAGQLSTTGMKLWEGNRNSVLLVLMPAVGQAESSPGTLQEEWTKALLHKQGSWFCSSYLQGVWGAWILLARGAPASRAGFRAITKCSILGTRELCRVQKWIRHFST